MIKLIAAGLILFSTLAHATIYSYTAKDGKVYYVNYRPAGLTTTEYNLFKFVSASAWDTLTNNAGQLVDNRNRVKAIMKADLAPVVIPPVIVPPVIIPPEPPAVIIPPTLQRVTKNEFGGIEVIPKIPNGECMVLNGINIYEASQVINGTVQCNWL